MSFCSCVYPDHAFSDVTLSLHCHSLHPSSLFSQNECPGMIFRSLWLWYSWVGFMGIFLSHINFPSSKRGTECREGTMHSSKTSVASLQGWLILSLQHPSHSGVHIPASIFRGTTNISVGKQTKMYSCNILAVLGRSQAVSLTFRIFWRHLRFTPFPCAVWNGEELQETPTK